MMKNVLILGYFEVGSCKVCSTPKQLSGSKTHFCLNCGKIQESCLREKAFQVQVSACRIMSLLRHFQVGLTFLLKHLINQADVQFC